MLAIAFTWMAMLPRFREPLRWRWTLVAAVAATGGVVDWFLVVAPMNGALNGWTPESLPVDWTRVRNRWEIGHAVQAALYAIGFIALERAAIVAVSEPATRSPS